MQSVLAFLRQTVKNILCAKRWGCDRWYDTKSLDEHCICAQTFPSSIVICCGRVTLIIPPPKKGRGYDILVHELLSLHVACSWCAGQSLFLKKIRSMIKIISILCVSLTDFSGHGYVCSASTVNKQSRQLIFLLLVIDCFLRSALQEELSSFRPSVFLRLMLETTVMTRHQNHMIGCCSLLTKVWMLLGYFQLFSNVFTAILITVQSYSSTWNGSIVSFPASKVRKGEWPLKAISCWFRATNLPRSIDILPGQITLRYHRLAWWGINEGGRWRCCGNMPGASDPWILIIFPRKVVDPRYHTRCKVTHRVRRETKNTLTGVVITEFAVISTVQ